MANLAKPIYAVHCQVSRDWHDNAFLRISIMRGPECRVSTQIMAVPAGFRYVEKLADKYNVPADQRSGLFCGTIVPFDIDQDDDREGGAA